MMADFLAKYHILQKFHVKTFLIEESRMDLEILLK
jgi:hypothetical protein